MNLRAQRSTHVMSALVCLLISSLLSGGCGPGDEPESSQPPKPEEATAAAEPEAEPEPEPEAIKMAPLASVTLDPGQSGTVAIELERNGNTGPIRVEATDVPDGITVAPIDIPAEQSAGELKITAAQKLGDEELSASFPVKATLGELETSERLFVTVKKLNLPSFQPAGTLILQPGKTGVVELAVVRDGFEGPLQLRVEGLPQKVTAKVENIAAGQAGTKLQLTAAKDAAEGEHEVRVTATILGRTISGQVPLQVDRQPYRVQSFKVVVVKPGERNYVEVPIERRSYDGPLSLEVTNLPDGVSVAKVDLLPGEEKALLEFLSSDDARECVRSAQVVSQGGGLLRTDPMIVRVSHGGQGFLPRAVTANDELFHLLRRGSFGGRLTTESKQALIEAYGGTPQSEEAVLRGLRWLVAHQQPDGHWSLENYPEGIEGCDCKTEFEAEVGEFDTAATAFGVLPLLGAGVTHNRAPEEPEELAGYRKNVEAGLAFLARNQVIDTDSPNVGHLGGNMYAHALGAMALCEAYGLSGDERLKVPAQLAIKYLRDAQHGEGGGWRYSRNQPGDMSVTAWVFLAIRSGQLAGLMIDRGPLVRAERFLDTCAAGPDEAKGSRYSYQPAGEAKLSLSAAGLLTRQYLGCRKDDGDLTAGCAYLMQHLPPTSGSLGTIYYYHYATQVLHHIEGSDFDLWNHRMREHLIRTQEKQGHKTGSWNPQGTDFGHRGGRIYATGMALLTLQVYYRHLPMYRPVIRVQGTDVRGR